MRFGVLGSAIVCLGFSACTPKATDLTLPTSGTTVFEDSFTGTDGSAPNTWTVVAAGGSTFDISSNRAHPAQGGGASPMAFYPVSLDKVGYTTTVDLVISGGAYTGDAYLFAKSQAMTTIADSYVCGIDGSTGKLSLSVIQSGTPTVLAVDSTVLTPLPDGTTASLSFDVQSFISVSMICTLTLNGVTYTATAADITFPNAGYWGLFGGKSGSNYLYFDNFKIVN